MFDALEAIEKRLRDGERALNQAIGERDAVEECLSQMYYLVTGNSPEWSNRFGHEQALEDVGDVLAALKAAIDPKFCPNATAAPIKTSGGI
jgi:hypothetical protein